MLRCEMCGRPAEVTPLGSLICPACRQRYREFRCGRCGQRVACLGDLSVDWPELTAGVCSACQVAERVAALAEADREAIRAAAGMGTIAGIKEARARLECSIPDAVSAVELLRDRG